MSNWFQNNRHLYPPEWEKLAAKIKKQAGYKCEACGLHTGPNSQKLGVDHFDSNPQNNHPDNLIPLCQRCHLRRHQLYPPAKTRAEAITRLAERARLEQTQLNMFEELPL